MRLFAGMGRKDGRRRQESARIKALMIAVHGLGEDVAIAVNEILCADPACPGDETVILVMAPGEKTKAFKVANALEEVGEADIAALALRSTR